MDYLKPSIGGCGMPPKFRGENFHGWLSNFEIQESFLPRMFPAIRYSLRHFSTI